MARKLIHARGHVLAGEALVPDCARAIVNRVRDWFNVRANHANAGQKHVDIVVTLGGTGCSPRDVTPEAVLDLVSQATPGHARRLTGVETALTAISINHTPMGALSRFLAVSFVPGSDQQRCLVICLPGSPKAVEQCLDFLLPILPHALNQLRGHHDSVHTPHKKVAPQRPPPPPLQTVVGAPTSATLRDKASTIVEKYQSLPLSPVKPPDTNGTTSVARPVSEVCNSTAEVVSTHPPTPVNSEAAMSLTFAPGECHAVTPSVIPPDGSEIAIHNNGIEAGVIGDVSGDVTQRLRESPHALFSVEDAMAEVLAAAEEITTAGIDWIPPSEVVGRRLATPLKGLECVPPYDASIKDGYACLLADGAGSRRVVGVLRAGDAPPSGDVLKPGTCFRVSTGGPLPPGADCIVQIEDTELVAITTDASDEAYTGAEVIAKEESEIWVKRAPTKPGQDIRPKAADLEVGAEFPQDLLIGVAELGLLAAAGLLAAKTDGAEPTLLPCRRRIRIGVLSTGSELMDASARGEDWWRRRDSNRPCLIAALRAANREVVDLGISGDTEVSLTTAFSAGFEQCDVVVTTGGVSMGEADLIHRVLVANFDARLRFGRVRIKPGKPTTLVSLVFSDGQTRLVFGLPGNPASAIVTSQLFVLPALRRLEGYATLAECRPSSLYVRLAHDVEGMEATRPEYRRAKLYWTRPEDSNGVSRPEATCRDLGDQISSRLASFAGADILLVLPAAVDDTTSKLSAGSVVQAILIDGIARGAN